MLNSKVDLVFEKFFGIFRILEYLGWVRDRKEVGYILFLVICCKILWGLKWVLSRC